MNDTVSQHTDYCVPRGNLVVTKPVISSEVTNRYMVIRALWDRDSSNFKTLSKQLRQCFETAAKILILLDG